MRTAYLHVAPIMLSLSCRPYYLSFPHLFVFFSDSPVWHIIKNSASLMVID